MRGGGEEAVQSAMVLWRTGLLEEFGLCGW